MKTKLTKREYIGVGFYHNYTNNETKEEVIVPCSKEEYYSNDRPILDGLTYTGRSNGETVKVDSPTTVLGLHEYCDYEDGYYVVTTAKDGDIMGGIFSKDKIVDNVIDNSLIN